MSSYVHDRAIPVGIEGANARLAPQIGQQMLQWELAQYRRVHNTFSVALVRSSPKQSNQILTFNSPHSYRNSYHYLSIQLHLNMNIYFSGF